MLLTSKDLMFTRAHHERGVMSNPWGQDVTWGRGQLPPGSPVYVPVARYHVSELHSGMILCSYMECITLRFAI